MFDFSDPSSGRCQRDALTDKHIGGEDMFYSYSVCPIDLTAVAIGSILLFVVFFAPGKHTEKLREVDELCISPVHLAFDLSLIAFYDFIFVSFLSCLEVCPNESLPKSDDRNMFKFAFEI